MYHQIRHFRQTKAIFGMDFQNGGEDVGECIAGVCRSLHINANGDAYAANWIETAEKLWACSGRKKA